LKGLPFSVLAVAFATAWSAPAWAAPVELQWNAAASCPSASYVVGEVGRILGGSSGPESTVRARADVTHEESGPWKVTLTTQGEGASGRRSFSAESCQALADATALILAMTVNPNVTPTEPPPTPAAAPVTEPAPPAPAPPSSSTPNELLHFSVRASLAGDVGMLPSASVGPEVGLAWLPGHLRAEVSASYLGPQLATSAASQGAGADIELWTFSARAGYAWPVGTFALGPLAGVDVESLSADGFGGTASSFHQSAVLAAIGGGGLLMWSPLPSLGLRLTAQAEVPLSRPSFVVVDPAPAPAELVHRPSAIGGRAALGVEWRFF
jgi:hypothetical protein